MTTPWEWIAADAHAALVVAAVNALEGHLDQLDALEAVVAAARRIALPRVGQAGGMTALQDALRALDRSTEEAGK